MSTVYIVCARGYTSEAAHCQPSTVTLDRAARRAFERMAIMSDDALTMRGPVHGTTDAKRVAIGSGVGAVIETYDFIGFGTAAALYFGHAFFPNSSPVAGTLLSF